MKSAQAFIAQHLRECCQELTEWDNTAILRDGRVREAARIYHNVSSHSALAMARSEIERQAVVYTSETHK
jgi:predicted ATP-grasp superfamily ATP-dependent carboligase